MHVLDLFNDKDRTFLEGMVNTEGEIVDFPGKRNVRSIGPKQPTDGEVIKLKTPPKPQVLSTKDLAMISDRALDAAYGYGRSVPGPNFGWLANMNSAMFAKRAIDSGVTDIEKIAAEIHKGWASAAIGDYKNKLPINPPTPHETKLRRLRLAQVAYNELPEKEKEKDRVVARALLQAISGKEIPGGNDVTEGDVVPMPQRPHGEPVVNVQPASVVPFSQFKDPGTRKLEMWKQKVRDRHPEYGNRIRFVSKDNGAVVSAEIPGVDRSFGVFDMATETGQVLDEGLRDPKDNPCWKGYHPVGTKKKNGRTVPNCVPNTNESLAEGQTEGEATLAKIAASGDEGWDMIYDGINGLLGTEAQIMLQDMYDDVSREYRLHPDDDFEEIQSHMMDRIQDDYGQQGVAEGVDPATYPARAKEAHEKYLKYENLVDQELRKFGQRLPKAWDAARMMTKLSSDPKYALALKYYKLSEKFASLAIWYEDLAKKRQGVAEGFKNTYSVGDRVDGPLGTGTVVAVSKNVNVDGKVKVKLDDPSRAGEDGKYKDSFVLDTTQLKHIDLENSNKTSGTNGESDLVNEVSDETLINYLTKVHQDALKHKADPSKRSPEKASKSIGGFNRAFNKLDARPRKDLPVTEVELNENEKEGKPRIRKYTKMRPDGSKAVRYEVLDYRSMRIPGQGTEGFDDPKYAKEFYYRNYDKLQNPYEGVEEQVQEEPIREVAGRYWCKNEKRWKNVE